MVYANIDKYIDHLITESTPDMPVWNIESIRQGKKPHWNYIDGCMITSLLQMNQISGEDKYFNFAESFIDYYVKDDGSILVKADVRTVRATGRLAGTDDNRFHDFALLHVATRDCVLHGRDNGVAEPRVTAARSPEHTNREQLLGTGVIGNLKPGFLLNHLLLLVP